MVLIPWTTTSTSNTLAPVRLNLKSSFDSSQGLSAEKRHLVSPARGDHLYAGQYLLSPVCAIFTFRWFRIEQIYCPCADIFTVLPNMAHVANGFRAQIGLVILRNKSTLGDRGTYITFWGHKRQPSAILGFRMLQVYCSVLIYATKNIDNFWKTCTNIGS